MSEKKYIVTHSEMVGIADKLREKDDTLGEIIFPSGWEEAIENLSSKDIIHASEYPDYISTEALDIINKVRSVQQDDSITFIAMSDSHYPAEQTATSDYTNNKASSIHANKAMKAITYLIKPDFVAHLGDVCTGADTTTPEMLKSQIKGFLSLFKEAKSDIPVFLAVGNHDGGIYYHNKKADGTNYCMTGEYLYDVFTSQSTSVNTVFGDASYGGYCYRDFIDKKLRVFLLNTSEGIAFRQTDSCTLAAQRLWFANALIDLNKKKDADKWGFVVLCHYPADYGGTMPLSELFKAYVTGGSITITGNSDESFTSKPVSFSEQNRAKFIAQFHGHVHNFKTSKLYSYATGKGVQYDAWRMCIPNTQYNRENYYSTVGSYTDINFAEEVSYPKTAKTADGTSFVVNVINPSEEKIYSFCYGAGYDRVMGYGTVTYYSVSRSLTNVTSDNTSVSIEKGKSYSENITLDSGADMKTITVTMGGVDISSSAISIVDGVYHISISEVTGNIVITAKATLRPNFTNLVPLSINTDGSDYNVDGDGYDNNVYLSSGNLSVMSGITTTGFIPVKTGEKIIRIAGEGISIDNEYTRFSFYDSSFAHLSTGAYKHLGTNSYWPVEIKEPTTALTIQMDKNDNGQAGVYMRICTKGDGANLIVTVDEEITYGGNDPTINKNYTVTNILTNVTSDNNTKNVVEGDPYIAHLAANTGYEIESVTVTMSGLDVTDKVYRTDDNSIQINTVTGNIVITAIAKSTASYTNMIPLSTTEIGGSEVYNSPYGYKTGYRINSSNQEVQRDGMCCTGFIALTKKAGDIIRIKNVTIEGSDTPYLLTFDEAGKGVSTAQKDALLNGGDGSHGYITVTIEDDVIVCKTNITNIAAMRLSVGTITDESIITVNQEITE